MYDPLIVDTFTRIYKEIAPQSVTAEPHRHALNEIAGARQSPALAVGPSRLDDIAASADEMLTLYELAQALGGQASVSELADVITRHLRRLIPSSLCVFFAYDPRTGEIEATHAVGEAASVVRGLKISLGERVSGWVAANRQTIVNSDPTLDLGDFARSSLPRLRSCLSTPLLVDDELIGVLTLYATATDGFNEDHRRIIEVVARHIAHAFKRASEFSGAERRDPLTGLPSLTQLEQFVTAVRVQQLTSESGLTLLFIEIVDLERITATHGQTVADEVLRHVVRHSRTRLRAADILFRYGSHEFVALLNDTDSATADTVAEGIRQALRENPLTLRTAAALPVDIEVNTVCAPRDGHSLTDLIATARIRGAVRPTDSTIH
jgi:diguanylate cyclase (GGDEF)-like protein